MYNPLMNKILYAVVTFMLLLHTSFASFFSDAELETYHTINQNNLKALNEIKQQQIRQLIAQINTEALNHSLADMDDLSKRSLEIYFSYQNLLANLINSDSDELHMPLIHSYITNTIESDDRPYFADEINSIDLLPYDVQKDFIIFRINEFTEYALSNIRTKLGHACFDIQRPFPLIRQHDDSVKIVYLANYNPYLPYVGEYLFIESVNATRLGQATNNPFIAANSRYQDVIYWDAQGVLDTTTLWTVYKNLNHTMK